MSSRATGTAVVVCLILAAAGAFARAEQLKLIRAPVASPTVTRYYSPVCPPGPRCASHGAQIRFFLRTPSQIRVVVQSRSGHAVRDLTPKPGRTQPRGWVHVVWDGKTDQGSPAADGRYRVAVTLVGADRTFTLPRPLNLDTVSPTLRITRPDGAPVVRYTVSKRAAVFAEFRAVSGHAPTRRFLGRHGIVKAHPGKLVSGVTYRIRVYAVDPAGNRSPLLPAGTYTA